MKNIISPFISMLGIIVLIAMILGVPLMLLWNWLMPTLFGLPTITFWQAIGLNFLSAILFNKTPFKAKS